MDQKQIKNVLESILFVADKPLKAKELAKMLELEEAMVKEALEELAANKKSAGIVLLSSTDGYQLATNSAYSTQVKNYLNAELREKLTDATVEVLAIITYRQPISKAEIEAIRGVNSQYSIRNLLMRGLIEKVPNPADSRSALYRTTTEFLMHLGITAAKDLPDFETLVEQIKLPETPALQNLTMSSEPSEEETVAQQSETNNSPSSVESDASEHTTSSTTEEQTETESKDEEIDEEEEEFDDEEDDEE